jgi:glycoside hydrolase-like protein
LGKKFAVRYGGPGSSDKQLDLAEANALAAAGLWVVANAEGSAQGLLGGFDVGASWARTAAAHFKRCGMPDDRPIYLSVDFDPTSAQWPAVRDALAGAASVVGLARVGVYGGYWACQWAYRDGVAPWLWQTYAWSTWKDPDGVRRLHWLSGTHLQQYRNGVVIDGADCDLNRALAGDFGQWQPGNSYGPIGDDMALMDDPDGKFLPGRILAALYLEDVFSFGPDKGKPVPLTAAIKKLQADVDTLKTGGVPPADLVAAFKDAVRDPEVLAAIAKAVTDEIGS